MKLRDLFVLDRHRGLAMLTLALGLGAGAIGFTVLHSVLLRPLPFPQAHTLYSLHHTAPGLNLDRLEVSDATYLLYRQSPALEDLAIYRTTEVDVTGGQTPERLSAALVSPELLPMLGATPIHGRGFAPDEERPGNQDAVLIGAEYRARRFGADAEVLGQSLIVDGRPRTIVGVLAPSFRFPSPEIDLWLPIGLDPQTARGALFGFSAVARVSSIERVAPALEDLGSRLERLEKDYPQSGWTADLLQSSSLAPVLKPLKEEMVGSVHRWVWGQAVAVGLLLLAACLNVATLLMVRAEDRRSETALRVALGANRRQLLFAHLIPALTLGLMAGILGLGLATFGLQLLATHGPEILGSVRQLTADRRTVFFTLGPALALGTVLGFVTGLRRPKSPAIWLRSGAARPNRQTLRSLMVISQVAVATALCVGAGTLSMSLFELRRVDPGFNTSDTFSFDLRLPRARYAQAADAADFYIRLLDGLSNLPGITATGGVHRLPLTGGGNKNGWTAEGAGRAPDEVPAVFATRWASEGYFDAMDITLLQGRFLEPADREQLQPVVVVSRSFATHFWGDEDPLGRRVALGTGEHEPWYRVVGVVADLRDQSLNKPTEAMAYLPLLTHLPRREAPYSPSRLSLVLRGSVTDEGLPQSIRNLVAELDPELPISNLGPMKRLAREDMATSRFALGTLLATAWITLLLGIVGLFGLIDYQVRQRRRDFGVRLALGADPRRLQKYVQGMSLRLTAIGVALGLLIAAFAGNYVEHLIFGVRAVEPWIYMTVAMLFLITALLATYGPARHAAGTDPREALRQD